MIIFCKSNTKIYKMNKKNEVLTSFFRKKVHNFRCKTKKGSNKQNFYIAISVQVVT